MGWGRLEPDGGLLEPARRAEEHRETLLIHSGLDGIGFIEVEDGAETATTLSRAPSGEKQTPSSPLRPLP